MNVTSSNSKCTSTKLKESENAKEFFASIREIFIRELEVETSPQTHDTL